MRSRLRVRHLPDTRRAETRPRDRCQGDAHLCDYLIRLRGRPTSRRPLLLAELREHLHRIGNPTNAAFEERIASLEGGLGALATSSGQAATADLDLHLV